MRRICMIVVLLIGIFGCAGPTMEITDQLFDMHKANIEAGLKMSDRMFETWAIDSAFLRESLKNHMTELTQATIKDWNTLDAWAKKERSGEEKIRALILRVRISSDILTIALKQLPGPIYERLIEILW